MQKVFPFEVSRSDALSKVDVFAIGDHIDIFEEVRPQNI